jgi:hypothetical protein
MSNQEPEAPIPLTREMLDDELDPILGRIYTAFWEAIEEDDDDRVVELHDLLRHASRKVRWTCARVDLYPVMVSRCKAPIRRILRKRAKARGPLKKRQRQRDQSFQPKVEVAPSDQQPNNAEELDSDEIFSAGSTMEDESE